MQTAGMHILEAVVFASAAFVMALACVWALFSLLRGVIFSYLDELDKQAWKVKNPVKGIPEAQKGQLEIARGLSSIALAIVSAAKTLLVGAIILAMAIAVVG